MVAVRGRGGDAGEGNGWWMVAVDVCVAADELSSPPEKEIMATNTFP